MKILNIYNVKFWKQEYSLPIKIFNVRQILAGKRPDKYFNHISVKICQGDTVVVDVENLMPGGRSVSIHWHGIKQTLTPWMDGASFLTQCPIHSNQIFRYEFRALEAGTFFYHASDSEFIWLLFWSSRKFLVKWKIIKVDVLLSKIVSRCLPI